ncbi:uncharacterized protein APUU_51453S [Aspergillus puulaauensis]|uniref:Uncharacterized protein n=1 Tax=Aspergillus puulaauensis TaxID=1220207 RepID=A0A7R8AQ69_9EURO|nr:uncharacterized protein APUU_51453S [Aspergillus puulaauensis]BCS26742.1 hypothetical protein APUU_51453S [Aspergillus puulaauensis]
MLPDACIPCEDSPLSITGSILTILTFVYALVVSAAFYLHRLHRANEETYTIFERTAEDIVEQSVEIQAFSSAYLTGSFQHEDRVLQTRMQRLLKRTEEPLQIMQDFASKYVLDFKPDPRLFEKRFFGRAKFAVNSESMRRTHLELDRLRKELRSLEVQILIRHQQRTLREQQEILRKLYESGAQSLDDKDEGLAVDAGNSKISQ